MAQQNEDNLQFPRFIELELVDSTNNYALDLARGQNLTDRQIENLNGTTVFAHEQRAGKGQRGKSWISVAGKNLQMSLIITPEPIKLYQQFILGALIAVTVRDFLAENSGKKFCIKWPNDIYFQDRKAGGILIENIISGTDWKWAVTGIGLNINQTEFDPALPNPVSLKQITGMDFDCLALAKELSTKVFEMVGGYKLPVTGYRLPVAGNRVNTKHQTINILSDYNKHLYKRGEKVRLKKDNRIFEATVKEVTAAGQLVVEHGVEERFDFGEVVWVN